jgi:4-diphosphocytidyl-2-C-methyl-D-erythritol kinase
MKSAITLNAYAKINLFLDIGQKLENGYHEIVTVMQSVSLCDRLTVSKNVDSIHVVCDEKRIPGGEKNIAFKAAVAFF